jgi:hypothetical protein
MRQRRLKCFNFKLQSWRMHFDNLQILNKIFLENVTASRFQAFPPSPIKFGLIFGRHESFQSQIVSVGFKKLEKSALLGLLSTSNPNKICLLKNVSENIRNWRKTICLKSINRKCQQRLLSELIENQSDWWNFDANQMRALINVSLPFAINKQG